MFDKRMKGESDFSIGELAIIMQKFGLTFDTWADINRPRMEIMYPTSAKPFTNKLIF